MGTYHGFSTAEWEMRQELAAAYQLASLLEWTDLIYTHISLRVPGEADAFLINPFGLHFHEVTPENLIKISVTGEILSETAYTVNRAGLVVHSAIHAAKPEVQAIVHLHTVNGMAIAAIEEGLLPISQHACHFYGRIAYHDYQGIAIHDEEKQQLVENLGNKNIMILRNHGFLTAGQSLAEAFTTMYTLEKAAQVQISALSMGLKLSIPSHEVCQKVVHETGMHNIKNADIEWQALKRLLPYQRLSEEAFERTTSMRIAS
ncbi:class II aldolase/adducin family protein [Candidatus Finniella inopinata]|uniref:Class II aldolase/adducin family protein n=1 Tax=Candidatus Finniella inopinata TaxID=1696036 RepID=A0A4Q7DGX6_9PROT|nr:class II aldolase/adducin family protein [Candidatus Finniella inopinata]RZI46161.1 class II aldolase/adducin family protein [Candidatus Finniella inopinata]